MIFVAPDDPGKSTAVHVAETMQSAIRHASEAIETGRQPGMPLDIITKMVRDAPLASLGDCVHARPALAPV
jgi:hypothetical protein